MMASLLVDLAWKSALLAGLILILLELLRSRSAAEQSLVAGLGLASLLILPFAALALPAIPLSVGVPAAGTLPLVATDADPGLFPLEPARAIDVGSILLLVYAPPVALLMLNLCIDLDRLRRIRIRAHLLVDARWQGALRAARRRVKLDRSITLLVSDEITSPVCWGLLRPQVVVDRSTAADPGRADAVVTHEVAHVACLDWLRLLAGRAATAVYWFNPLVWMLARRSHRLCELAADDSVLRANIDVADYAELLVASVRRSGAHRIQVANGVAVARTGISERIGYLLQSERSRARVGPFWRAACLLALPAACGSLAAIDFVPRERSFRYVPVQFSLPPTAAVGAAVGSVETPGSAPAARPPVLPASSDLASGIAASNSSPIGIAAPGSAVPVTAPVDPPAALRAKFPDQETVPLDPGAARSEAGERRAERGEAWRRRGEEWRARGERLRALGEQRRANGGFVIDDPGATSAYSGGN